MSGLEDILAIEIQHLGGTQVEKLNRAVSFEGDLRTLYRVNYESRLALRVLKPLTSFRAHDETVLYKRLRRYDWTQFLDPQTTFRVNTAVHSHRYTHSHFIALKTKDAIVDQCRDRYGGRRPSIDLERPDITLDVYCSGTDFTISLDSSGESLYKRGYRQSQRLAPLNEVLAAGMITLADWTGGPLLDPMCGSGTILIEALMKAKNIPAQKNRSQFAFRSWPGHDSSLWQEVTSTADRQISALRDELIGFDINKDQISETQLSLAFMGYEDEVQLVSKDFFSSEAPVEEGTIITNPPYGIRVTDDDIMSFYKKMGDTMKQQYQGWSAWILCGNKDAIKNIGLKTSKKLTLYNGPIECKYHRYDMYRGSRKPKEG